MITLAGCNTEFIRNGNSGTFNIKSGDGGGTFTISSMTVVNPTITIKGNSKVNDGTYPGNRLRTNHWTIADGKKLYYATLQSDEITMLFTD